MKKVLVATCLVMLEGCSTVPVDLSATVHQADSTLFTLRDARPKSDAQSDMGSLSITNCNYGVRRIADVATIPDKISILKDDLQELAGQRLTGKTITIKSYTVYFNGALESRGAVGTMEPGIIAHAMVNIGCKKEDVSGGWYDADEVTNNNSPLVADLQVDVNGTIYHSRAVESPGVAIVYINGKDPNFTLTMRDVLRTVAKNLVAAMATSRP